METRFTRDYNPASFKPTGSLQWVQQRSLLWFRVQLLTYTSTFFAWKRLFKRLLVYVIFFLQLKWILALWYVNEPCYDWCSSHWIGVGRSYINELITVDRQWTTYTLTLLQLEQTYWFVWPEGTAPPTEPGFSQGFFLHSVTMECFVSCRCRLWLAQLGTLHFQHNHRLELHRYYLNWTKAGQLPLLNSIMKCIQLIIEC